MLLTRFIKMQLLVFAALTIVGLVVLSLVYLRLPTAAGIGMYRLYADLPNSAGLYETANVTYRGTTIGKVRDVQPTPPKGARITMDIDNDKKVPLDASANVHSVSAVGEQFLDIVSEKDEASTSARGRPSPRARCRPRSVPRWTPPRRALPRCPRRRSASCSTRRRKPLADWVRHCNGWWTPPSTGR